MNSSAVSAGRRTIRVLLVEDDPDQRVITQFWPAQVHGTAYAVEWARTYDEDLEHLRDSEFDVCLLDQRLGKHTGTDFLRAAVAGGYDAPMVVLTTADEPVVDEAAVRLGAAEYLVKTQVTPTLLDRSIRHAMARARQATGRSPTSTDSAGCAIPVDAAPREQNDALAHQDTLAALRESEAQFRLMAETTGAVLYRLRYDTLRYEYMSPAVERITGYTADEINELGFKSLVEQIEMPPGGPSREDLLSLRLKAEGHEHAAYYRVRSRPSEPTSPPRTPMPRVIRSTVHSAASMNR